MQEVNARRPLGRTRELVEQELDGELLLYDLRSARAHCLNATAALVYQASDGRRTVGDIRTLISQELKADVPEASITLALERLDEEDLLEDHDLAQGQTLPRRTLMRQIGLVGVALLPIISSIAAPSAILAASCTPNGGPCSLNNPVACCSQACTQPGGGAPAFCCTFAGGPFGCFGAGSEGETTTAQSVTRPTRGDRPPDLPPDGFPPKR